MLPPGRSCAKTLSCQTLNGFPQVKPSSPVLSSRLLWRHVEPVRVQIRSVDRAHLGGPKEAGRSIGGIVSAADVGLVHVAQARDRWRERREGSNALGTLGDQWKLIKYVNLGLPLAGHFSISLATSGSDCHRHTTKTTTPVLLSRLPGHSRRGWGLTQSAAKGRKAIQGL